MKLSSLLALSAVCSDAYLLAAPTTNLRRTRAPALVAKPAPTTNVRRARVPALLAKPIDVESSRAALNAALIRDATRLKGYGVKEQAPEEEEAGVLKQLAAVIYVVATTLIGWNYSFWFNRLLGQWRFLVGVAIGVAAMTLRDRVAKKGR